MKASFCSASQKKIKFLHITGSNLIHCTFWHSSDVNSKVNFLPFVTLTFFLSYSDCLLLNLLCFFFTFCFLLHRSQLSRFERSPIYDVEQPLHSPQLILQKRNKKETPFPFLFYTASIFTVSVQQKFSPSILCKCTTFNAKTTLKDYYL